MIYMSKIGVIGDYDSICGFSALGLDIFPAENAETAGELLEKLTSGDYGIIYITESYLKMLPEAEETYAAKMTPAIIPIPSASGSDGFGISRVKRYVEQAVGSDIIFNEEN